jgi:hypothetical protein
LNLGEKAMTKKTAKIPESTDNLKAEPETEFTDLSKPMTFMSKEPDTDLSKPLEIYDQAAFDTAIHTILNILIYHVMDNQAGGDKGHSEMTH